MIRRPRWEWEFRRTLPRGPRIAMMLRQRSGWGGRFGLFAVFAMLWWSGLREGDGVGTDLAWAGARLGLIAGLCGAVFGFFLMSWLVGDRELMIWTPAGLRESRRHKLRSVRGHLVFCVLLAMVPAAFEGTRAGTLPPEPVGTASLLSFATGALLVGGRWGRILLLLTGVGGFGLIFVGRLLRPQGDAFDLFAANVWLPSLPWSAANGLAVAPAAAWLVVGLLATHALAGWRWTWLADDPPPTLDDGNDDEDSDEEDTLPPWDASESPPLPETAALPWPGLAGIGEPIRPNWWTRSRGFFLTETQRRFAAPDLALADRWFRGTWWGIGAVALAIGVGTLGRHIETLDLPLVVGRLFEAAHIPGILLLSIAALVLLWPGRNSAFGWILSPTASLGQDALPYFAVFPIAASDWLRAKAKEWLLRTAWVGAVLSAALAVCVDPDFWQTGAPGRFALIAFPWLITTSLIPRQGASGRCDGIFH